MANTGKYHSPTVTAEVANLVDAASDGDAAAMNDLRDLITTDKGDALVETCGNFANQLEQALLMKLGDQEVAQSCVREKLVRLRNELGWAESEAMERILIERVVLTWLDMYLAEMTYAQGSTAFQANQVNQTRIDRAQRRHLAAIKMLATVRKMALPTLIEIRAKIDVNDKTAPQMPNSNRFSRQGSCLN